MATAGDCCKTAVTAPAVGNPCAPLCRLGDGYGDLALVKELLQRRIAAEWSQIEGCAGVETEQQIKERVCRRCGRHSEQRIRRREVQLAGKGCYGSQRFR